MQLRAVFRLLAGYCSAEPIVSLLRLSSSISIGRLLLWEIVRVPSVPVCLAYRLTKAPDPVSGHTARRDSLSGATSALAASVIFTADAVSLLSNQFKDVETHYMIKNTMNDVLDAVTMSLHAMPWPVPSGFHKYSSSADLPRAMNCMPLITFVMSLRAQAQ